MDIHELATRLGRLEDERAILDTFHRYGHALDYGLEDEWVDCFTPDARFEVRRRLDPAHPLLYTGSTELKAFAAKHTRAPFAFHKHIVADSRITVDGDRATSVSYFLRVDSAADDGSIVVVAAGRYHDTLERSADRQWRIAERIAEVENR